jgi:hypothetical protein
MTTHPEQATSRDRFDPMAEALLKELLETASHAKAATRTEDAVTAALMASLIPPARTASQASSFEKAILAVALAPALADALADALVPAIVKALNTILSSKETGQEAVPKEDIDKQEGKAKFILLLNGDGILPLEPPIDMREIVVTRSHFVFSAKSRCRTKTVELPSPPPPARLNYSYFFPTAAVSALGGLYSPNCLSTCQSHCRMSSIQPCTKFRT